MIEQLRVEGRLRGRWPSSQDPSANPEVSGESAFEEWLSILVEGNIDRDSGERVAQLVMSWVRPTTAGLRMTKAHLLVDEMNRFCALMIIQLADEIDDDPDLLVAAAIAWCKRTALHVDLLLAVYSSTERGSNWY